MMPPITSSIGTFVLSISRNARTKFSSLRRVAAFVLVQASIFGLTANVRSGSADLLPQQMLSRPSWHGSPLPAFARLDRTFNGSGLRNDGFGGTSDFLNGAVVQPDGKIVIAGGSSGGNGTSDLVVARYDADGTPDPTFGTGCKQAGTPSLTSASAASVAVQPDGKVVAVGTFNGQNINGGTSSSMTIIRCNADGTRDTAFGVGGTFPNLGRFGSGTSVAIQPDGKIVVLGSSQGGFNT